LERTLFTLVMWNIADKRKRRIYPLSSPQLQRAREAKPHGVIGPELWCGIAVLRLVKGWVLAMLVPPVKNGRACAWLRSRRASKRGAFDPPCAPWRTGRVGTRGVPIHRRALAARRRTRGWEKRLVKTSDPRVVDRSDS
jgi:hypothetical protein